MEDTKSYFKEKNNRINYFIIIRIIMRTMILKTGRTTKKKVREKRVSIII